MDKTTAQRIAQRFVSLPLEQRRQILQKMSETGQSFKLLPIAETRHDVARIPLSYAQQQMLILWQLDPDNSTYNVPMAVRLTGVLDEAAMGRALALLVHRHEALRTRFVSVEGEFHQEILDESPVVLQRVDIAVEPAESREARLQDLVATELATPFDLLQGPLVRARLWRLDAHEHVLTLCMHHSVSDGWSGELLVQEFIRFYLAEVSGSPAGLAPLPIQYADYAIWQRAWLEAGEGERQLAYWKQQLGEEQPLLELPLDHERPAVASHRGAIVHANLSPLLSAQLKARARQNGQTVFMQALAALAVVLARSSGQADIRIGAPNAGRNREELEGLIGFFINTQVLRIQVDERDSLEQLLEQVKQVVTGAQSHQELPFEQLVDALAPERNLSHNPLFQVKINQNVLAARSDGVPVHSALSVEAFAIGVADARFDLALDFTDTPEGIEAEFTYATDLFAAATIERLARAWQQVLEQMASSTGMSLLEQPGLPADYPAAAQAQFPCRDFLALWEQGRHAGQGKPALRCAAELIDYDELERRSNKLARLLQAEGIGVGNVVALCQERSIDWVVALLAVLKVGAVYLPLDNRQPAERLQQLLKDSAASLLIHAPGDSLAANLGVCPTLAAEARQWADQDSSALALRVDPEQPAYIIYTSGSTGQPKGVLISHRGLANYVQAVLQRLQLAPGASLALVSTIAADLGHTQLFGALAAGRLLHLMPHEHAFDPDSFAAYMHEHQVDVLKIVPSHLQGLLQASRAADVLPRQLLILGGEASSWALIEQIRQLAPDCRIINHYGPTETTVGILTHEVRERLDGCRTVPVGQPLANDQARVLDAYLNPVAERVPGELYLGGAGLAQGYLGRAAMTAERFVPDPDARQGERLYRAGDRARWVDGRVEYLGRADDQVKIRGYRVEPGEVAQLLQGLDDVAEAVVLALPLESDATRLQLVAYCVAANGAALQGDTLRQQLQAGLPEYLVPAHILVLERLPLTANGKLDKRALPVPGVARQRHVAPVGEIEEKLAAVWADVLKLERVGSTDNFFELGGDSILSLQIIARAKRQGIKLSPKQLFEKQTIAQLATVAKLIEKKVTAETPRQASGEQPLLPIQARFFETDIPQRHHWNQALMLKPSVPLEVAHLQGALQAIGERHDVLRLRFAQVEGRWQASYHAALPAHELLWVNELEDRTRLAELANEAQRSLDLQQGPLWRALLVNLANGEQRLLLVIHHLVVDGVSWRVLLEDLQQAYRALAVGQAVVLAPASSSFKAWAERLQTHALSPSLVAEADYWLQASPAANVELPRDNPQGANTRRHAGSASSSLSRELTQQLLKVAPAAWRTQVNDLLLTALARVLCQWSEQASVMIQLEGHGREDLFDDLDLSRTVGWFSSLFPVLLTPQDSLGGSIAAIKEQLRAVPNKGIGYGVLRYLGAARTAQALEALPQARVTFNYLGQFDGSFAGDEAALFVPSGDDSGLGQNEDAPLGNWLSVNGQVYEGQLRLDWGFSTEVYRPDTVARLARAYEQALTELIEYCLVDGHQGVTPSDFPLAGLSQSQLERLPLPAGGIEDVYPLSPMQQGMLFHSLSTQDSGDYVNQMRVDVDGLDCNRFRAAWQAVIDRHEILRANFTEGYERPLQVIHKQRDVEFVEQDLRGHADLTQRLDELARLDLQRGFDLVRDPLLRLTVLRTAEHRHHLIYTNHHILLDGWSSARLLGEVLQHYYGQPPATAGSRFRDYIHWLQDQDQQASQRFWGEQMSAFDTPTYLGQALRSAAGETGYGDYLRSLDVAQTQRLSEFARQQRVTLNTLVQAAWLLLLQRYTGQRSVTFGATVSGRPAQLPGIEEQLGLFINTLPVVASPRVEQSVGQWVQQIQVQNLALREHEYTPLYDIQRWAGWSGEALFDSLLVFENYPASQALEQGTAEDLRFSGLQIQEQNHYPLTLVVEVGEVLAVRYRHDRQQLGDEALAQVARHFEHLLLALAENAERSLGELPLLNADEGRQILGQWNRTQADYPAGQCIHSLIEAQVARTPETVALVFNDQQLTYAQLNVRANRLAHALRERGVGPDVLVGICAERSLEMVVGLLAILKAGGAYVPLDPDYPRERLAYMFEDSGIGLLLTQSWLLEGLPLPASVQPFCLDHPGSVSPQAAEDNLPNCTLPDNLAYVIYTSGSTGRPKGAGNSHRALNNRLHWMQQAYGLGTGDRVLQKTPFSFDVSVWEFFWPLLTGARLVVANPGEHRDPQQLMETIRRHDINTLHFVPSMLQVFMASPGVEQCQSLRRVICSGEALPAELSGEVLRRLPWSGLFNLYGPTEAAIDVTHWTCTEADRISVPIGQPIDNLKTHVLDSGLLPVANGCAAELYLGGVGLARGYHQRPALTAERFVPDPHDPVGGGRLYRTGDLARYRDDGVIEYAGRIDHQIKIRGLRVELGEIEARLSEHAMVREAIVIDIEGAMGKQLVAYLVPSEASLLDAGQEVQRTLQQALREHLKAGLPEHMVPSALVLLERMPLSPNGKLDRKALPAPDTGLLRSGYRAPRSELEQQLAELWSQLLEVEQVGLDDNFFELGGHSLLVVALVGRIRERFEVTIKLHDFLLLRTLQDLAEFMSQGQAKVKSPVIAMNASTSAQAPLFCLPPGGGGTYAYYPLAGALAARRRVYGLVNKSYVVPGWFDKSWEEMVAYYLEQIRATQPRGPYNLLGWSLGGALAIEVAHLLEQAGEQVSFVGLVDAPMPAGSLPAAAMELPAENLEPTPEAGLGEHLVSSLMAFVPGLEERTVLELLEQAQNEFKDEQAVAERVIDQVAGIAAVDGASLRAMYRDIAVQDEIETGYRLLHANAVLSEAFTLKPLQVRVDCWWAARSKSAEQIRQAEALLLRDCSVNGLAGSVVLDERHDKVVLNEQLLKEVVQRLGD